MSKLCPFCQKSNKTAANFCNNCGGALETLSHPLNTMLDRRYRITGHIKQGGMANVYRAEDTKMGNRPCAIKEMLEHPDNEEMQAKFTEWFEREMQILSNLRHHGIPGVWNYFVTSGRFYIIMELLNGRNLEDFLLDQADGSFDEKVVLKWALEISDILDYIHTQTPPVIHRDIKPSNIILKKEGRLMLIDFGIARFFTSAKTGTRIGTMGFIAPEHYKGRPEPRSDLFSLGVTLYQLLTGIDPQTEVPYNLTPLNQVKPALSPYTGKVVTTLMALNPDHRYASAEALMTELKDFLAKGIVPAASPSFTIQPHLPPPSPVPAQPSIPEPPADSPASASLATQILSGFVFQEPQFFAGGPPGKDASKEGPIPSSPPAEAPFRPPVQPSISQASGKKDEEHKETNAPVTIQVGSPRYFYLGAPKTALREREIFHGTDNARMVLVREGSFLMGASFDEEAYFYEKPLHGVNLQSFYIDRCAVTVGQFITFLRESGYTSKTVALLNIKLLQGNFESHPMINVSWYDAAAYARWAQKRLPLEAEWEKAARGTDSRKYPWGNSWDQSRLNSGRQAAYRNTTPVGTFPRGISPYGCLDMAGNVWEWTLDSFAGYPCPGPSSKKPDMVAIRGGSWLSTKKECRCSAREQCYPSMTRQDLGFRCAVTAE